MGTCTILIPLALSNKLLPLSRESPKPILKCYLSVRSISLSDHRSLNSEISLVMGGLSQTLKCLCTTLLIFVFIFLLSSSSSVSSSTQQIQDQNDPSSSVPIIPTTHHHQVFDLKNNDDPIFQERFKKRMLKKKKHRKKKKTSKNLTIKPRPFSVMLPKGYVPPSHSSPCHNQYPTSMSFRCHLDDRHH